MSVITPFPPFLILAAMSFPPCFAAAITFSKLGAGIFLIFSIILSIVADNVSLGFRNLSIAEPMPSPSTFFLFVNVRINLLSFHNIMRKYCKYLTLFINNGIINKIE